MSSIPSTPRSVYLHVPFCKHRCGYCNFSLIAGRDDLIPAYLSSMELEICTSLHEPVAVDTVFLGGGTPSHLPTADLARLLEIVQTWFQLDADGEFSCEVNPHDCSVETLQTLRAGGVNRLSLGGQSFDNGKLNRLERDHTGEELSEALDLTAQYFANVSLDLIFSAPQESLETWQADISRALSNPIQHLSTYGLTIERGAAFYGRLQRNELSELDADLQLAMYEFAIDQLAEQGWEHYEVSNFALPGYRCRHNEAYWLGQPWWAFGPGAARFLRDPTQGWIRSVNHRSTTTYIRKIQSGQSPTSEFDILTREDYVRERLVFGLRRLEGVNLRELDPYNHYGPVESLFEPFLTEFIDAGWLERDHDQIRLTRPGLFVSDSLWPDLLTPFLNEQDAS